MSDTEPSGYVSPFQERGHDGPCHDMPLGPDPRIEQVIDALTVPLKVVAYEGEGLTLVSGEYEVPKPTRFDEQGRPVIDTADVKRALAKWLRDVADEIDEQADIDALDRLDESGPVGGTG